ncbi:Uncharacterised protein [Vibrio cholerae]|nr:Uncharacterised protein [Vibrio cholerae]
MGQQYYSRIDSWGGGTAVSHGVCHCIGSKTRTRNLYRYHRGDYCFPVWWFTRTNRRPNRRVYCYSCRHRSRTRRGWITNCHHHGGLYSSGIGARTIR